MTRATRVPVRAAAVTWRLSRASVAAASFMYRSSKPEGSRSLTKRYSRPCSRRKPTVPGTLSTGKGRVLYRGAADWVT